MQASKQASQQASQPASKQASKQASQQASQQVSKKATVQEYEQMVSHIKELDDHLKPAPDSKNVHSVFTTGIGKVYIRETSCLCSNCWVNDDFNPETSCDGWLFGKVTKASVHEFRNTEMSVSPQSDHNPISSHESHGKRSVHISMAATPPSLPDSQQLDKQNPGQPAAAANVEYTNGSFINALFEGKHYVGQLIDIAIALDHLLFYWPK